MKTAVWSWPPAVLCHAPNAVCGRRKSIGSLLLDNMMAARRPAHVSGGHSLHAIWLSAQIGIQVLSGAHC